MIRNYFVVAIRDLLKRKTHSFITILGLAVGLACCILILTYVRYEFGYDRYHPQTDQIYRILRETKFEDGSLRIRPNISGALAKALERDTPEVKQAIRFFNYRVGFQYQDKLANLRFCMVDPEFFDAFDFPLLNGDPLRVLSEPASILITEQAAKRFFGSDDPMGKLVTVKDDLLYGEYQVAGVVKDIPRNSTIRFDFITTHMPSHFAKLQWEDWLPGNWRMTWVFVVLPEEVDVRKLETKLQNMITHYMGDEVSQNNSYHIQPLSRIRLYSNVDYGIQTSSDINTIYVLIVIAFLILSIACLNFMNLSTARSLERRKEVGIRKVFGAQRFQIVHQFLIESTLISNVALILAVFFSYMLLPNFNVLVMRDLQLDWTLLPYLVGLAIIIGIGAGIYPSLFLSSFKSVAVMKNIPKTRLSGERLRKGLTLLQFSMSCLLIISSVVVSQQLHYLKSRDLGFDQDQVLKLWIFTRNGELRTKTDLTKERFLQHPDIHSASVIHGAGMRRPVASKIRKAGTDQIQTMYYVGGDEDLVETYGFDLVAGRNLRKGAENEFIVNETAVKRFGWENPIGKQVEWIEKKRTGTVVGVVKDFHYSSFQSAIEPVFIGKWFSPNQLALKIGSENIPETLKFIEDRWKEMVPKTAFSYRFLDARVDGFYRDIRRTNELANISSILSIILACMGLFGVVSFMIARQTKEIAVRKVLGASVSNILILVLSNFSKLILISGLLACPVAYYMMSMWLQDFVYRIELGYVAFLFGMGSILVVALLTVIFQVYHAAMANPIDSLRDE